MSTETAGIPWFYPQRPSVAVVEARERLSNVRKLNLSESERAEVLGFESWLTHGTIELIGVAQSEGARVGLEEIYEMWKPDDNMATFYLEYFLDDQGKQDAREILGIDLTHVTDLHQIEALLCTYDSRHLDNAGVRKMLELGGRSRVYAEERLSNDFEKANYGADIIAFNSIVNPPRITIITNVDSFTEQTANYARLRKVLRSKALELSETVDNYRERGLKTDLPEGKVIALEMHRKKLNTLIVDTAYPSALHLLRQYEVVRKIALKSSLLTKEGRMAFMKTMRLGRSIKRLDGSMQLAGFGYKKPNLPLDMLKTVLHMEQQIEVISRDNVARNLRRLDVFRHGAGSLQRTTDNGVEVYLSGRAVPLNQELREMAEGAYSQQKEIEGVEARFNGDEKKRLDEVKLGEDYWIDQARDLLRSGDLLTQDDQFDGYTTRRPSDNLWGVVSKSSGSIAEASKDKHAILFGPKFSRSLKRGILTLVHEFTHVVQHDNREKLKLEIFKKVGIARSGMYFEAGALAMEAEASRVLFGERRRYLPHFLMAIEAKLNGGTFKDTIKAFYDSYLQMNPDINKKRSFRTINS